MMKCTQVVALEDVPNSNSSSFHNLNHSIEALLGSKDSFTPTWAQSVRSIIQELNAPSAVAAQQNKPKLQDDISKLEVELSKLRSALGDEDAQRRESLNKYLDLKGNIRVFCRIKPLLSTEQHARIVPMVNAGCDKVLIPVVGKRKDFRLDRVFPPLASQDDVFAEVEQVLRSALDGHNVCMLAYGQTGTGKTFMMEGTDESPGIVPRVLWQLFKLPSGDSTVDFHFTFSMLEMYMGYLRDLLAIPPKQVTDRRPKCLSIQMDPTGSVEVENLTEFIITDFKQARKLYRIGNLARSTASTNANKASSRSHSLLRITITRSGIEDGSQHISKLWLVDLGGSERMLKTQSKGQTLEEGKAINSSLSALGDVINALQKEQTHIPYRNSKLTQVLRDCLGKGCKVLMIVNISPKEDDLAETVCSLNFAIRARSIYLGREISERGKEKRTMIMAEAADQMKIHEDNCHNIKEKIKELQFLLRKESEIFGVDISKVEQSREPPRQPKALMVDKKESSTVWSTSLPRFMTPTTCSRYKERMGTNGLNRYGKRICNKAQEKHMRWPFAHCKVKDAKVVPVTSMYVCRTNGRS